MKDSDDITYKKSMPKNGEILHRTIGFSITVDFIC